MHDHPSFGAQVAGDRVARQRPAAAGVGDHEAFRATNRQRRIAARFPRRAHRVDLTNQLRGNDHGQSLALGDFREQLLEGRKVNTLEIALHAHG